MTTLEEQIGWEEDTTKSEVYVREPQGSERVFTALRKFGIVSMLSICAKVNITLPNLENRLPLAWKKLRMTCPSIAMIVKERDGKAFFSYDCNDCKQWFESTFFTHDGVDAEELFKQLGEVVRPQFHWLHCAGIHEFYIKLPHAFIDGIGLLYLMNTFLDILALDDMSLEKPGKEVLRLSPSFSVASGAVQVDHGELMDMFGKIVTETPNVGCVVPLTESMGVPPTIEVPRVYRKVSKERTEAIVRSCKENNITVSHAVHAAMVLALVKINPPPGKETRYSAMLPINLRDRLLPQFRGGKIPVGLYWLLLNVFCTLPVAKEYTPEQFLLVAKDMKAEYQRLRDLPRIANLVGPFGHMIEASFNSQQAPSKNTPLLSSMGVADHYLKTNFGPNITLEGFTIRPNLTGGCQILLWTFKGCMELHLCATFNLEEVTIMNSWMDEILFTLETGLDTKHN